MIIYENAHSLALVAVPFHCIIAQWRHFIPEINSWFFNALSGFWWLLLKKQVWVNTTALSLSFWGTFIWPQDSFTWKENGASQVRLFCAVLKRQMPSGWNWSFEVYWSLFQRCPRVKRFIFYSCSLPLLCTKSYQRISRKQNKIILHVSTFL